VSGHDGFTPAAGDSSDPQALRAEIERTRAMLGETISALAAKTDVKARARSAAGEAATGVRNQLQDAGRVVTGRYRGLETQARHAGRRIASAPVPRAALLAGAAALAGLLVALVVHRRHR
jgi:hypothetical protein